MINFNPQILLPAELHGFVRFVLGRPDVAAKLAPIAEATALVAAAAAVAEQQSVPLDCDALIAILRPNPVRGGPGGPAPINLDRWPPRGWHPARFVATGGAPAIDWLWIGDRPLTQPFFDDEVRAMAALPFNWLFRIRTALPALVAGAADEPGIPLAGLIYHMSRCGSTLLGRMLAAVPGHIVSSEPEPLDGVIRWARLDGPSAADAVAAVRAIVAALGRDRGLGANCHFIKLDAWHAFSMPLLQAAFPDVPWVHLFRDSREVMVSTLQQPAIHTVQGLLPEAMLGFTAKTVLPREEFAARVLGGIGAAVVDHWPAGGGMVLAYPRIADAAPTQLAAHFGLTLDPASQAAMAAAAKRDAKAPDTNFAPDVTDKQSRVTPKIEIAVARWMMGVEKELERLAGDQASPRPRLN